MHQDGDIISFTVWFPRGKLNSIAQTIAAHVKNMTVGVTKGFQYVMKAAHSHFPMEFLIHKNGAMVEVRNFLGSKEVHAVDAMPGVTFIYDKEKKNELRVVGNDVQYVSQTAARVHQSCRIHNKDLRKFLDGVYVSESGPLAE